MTTARDLLTYLTNEDVVRIATQTSTGRTMTTPIWAVVVDGVGYIRNGWGSSSRWYRRATANGDVAFADDEHRHAVRLEKVEGSILDLIDSAYLAKYRGQPTDAVIGEPARSFTLRIEPA